VSNLNEDGAPSLYDYLAASMITIAIVWLWGQAAIHIPQFFESMPTILITAASYGFYTIGGAAASYLVLYKTGNRRAYTGLKVGAFCSVASALYYTIYTGFQPNLIVAILISFMLGGYLGARTLIKRAMRKTGASQTSADTELEEEDASSP